MSINYKKPDKPEKKTKNVTLTITTDELPAMDVLKKNGINISDFFRHCLRQFASELESK